MTLAIRRYAWTDDGLSEEERRRKLLDEGLVALNIALRTINVLESHGIRTVRDLLNCTPDRLKKIRGIGKRALEEIYGALEEYGFRRGTRSESKSDVEALRDAVGATLKYALDVEGDLTTTPHQTEVYEQLESMLFTCLDLAERAASCQAKNRTCGMTS